MGTACPAWLDWLRWLRVIGLRSILGAHHILLITPGATSRPHTGTVMGTSEATQTRPHLIAAAYIIPRG
jgi:hypothetical protein